MNVILTDKQINDNIDVIYSAIFVNEEQLKAKYKPIHQNVFYHHSTIEFKPKDISNLPIGANVRMKIIGRLTTDKVDVLLVKNPYSKNEYPHITLSTAEGIKPFQSNIEIKENLNKIKRLNDYVNGVIGLFTNRGKIVNSTK